MIRVTLLPLLLAALLAGCASLPQDPGRQPSSAITDYAGTRLHQQIQPMLDDNPGKSGFRTLGQGEEAFVARMRLAHTADRSLDVQYYIWHDDVTGSAMHHELLLAADRGVRVRLLLDDLDTAGKDNLLRAMDAHELIEVRLFNPFANRDNRAGDFIGDTRRVNRRMHNKTITADSLATIFGGRNIGDEYFAATDDVGFGDMDALAVGPIAAEVTAQFDQYWNSEWAYPIEAFYRDQPLPDGALQAFREDAADTMDEARKSEYAQVVQQYDMATIERLSDLDFVWSDWYLAFDSPDKIRSSKVSADTHLAPRLKTAMDRTRSDLVIVSPYFVPGEAGTEYLVGLVQRGVRVRILTNSLQANDVSLVHAGYMRYREDLLAGGVELYEFRVDANQRRDDGRRRIGASRSSLHAKFFGFDETWLFIGSFNLDGRSVGLNTELGAFYASPEQAALLSAEFDEVVSRIAYRLELDDRGKLQWIALQDGEQLTLHKEPDTTWWKRFSTGFLSLIVPESQL